MHTEHWFSRLKDVCPSNEISHEVKSTSFCPQILDNCYSAAEYRLLTGHSSNVIKYRKTIGFASNNPVICRCHVIGRWRRFKRRAQHTYLIYALLYSKKRIFVGRVILIVLTIVDPESPISKRSLIKYGNFHVRKTTIMATMVATMNTLLTDNWAMIIPNIITTSTLNLYILCKLLLIFIRIQWNSKW